MSPGHQPPDFELLADEDHAVADTYGVWVEKSMLADVIPKVSPKTHDEQVLKILGDL